MFTSQPDKDARMLEIQAARAEIADNARFDKAFRLLMDFRELSSTWDLIELEDYNPHKRRMITIHHLLDNTKCFETVRALHWPEGFPASIAVRRTLPGRERIKPSPNDSVMSAKPVSASLTI